MDLPDHELDLISQIPSNPLRSSKVIHSVSVYLYRSLDLITHSGVSHYPKGPALVPSDLARLISRSRIGIPLKSVKRSPSPKQSKH